MRQLESSGLEGLDALPPGTRFFSTSVFDPESGLTLTGSIAFSSEDQAHIERQCVRANLRYEAVLPHAAAAQVLSVLWGDDDGKWPEGYRIEDSKEVSREELRRRVVARAATASSDRNILM